MSIEGIRNLSRTALGTTTFCLTSAAAITAAFAQDVTMNSPVETVNVTARKSTLDKVGTKILDTPQSVNVIPLEVLHQQGTTTLADALKSVPGITLNAGEGGGHGDNVNLRGFSASDDLFLDGLRDTGTYFRDSFDLESVEVYKGPSSTLFGRGSTGGVVNQVSKTPETYPIDELRLTTGTNAMLRGTADVNYVVDDTTALRVNAMGESSHVADRDAVRNRRWGIAPSAAFGMGTDTQLTLNYLYQDEDDIPDYGIPFLNGKPAPVRRSNYYGLRDDDRSRTHVNVATAKFEHDFANGITFTDLARYGNYNFDFHMTAPAYNPAPPPGTPLGDILVYRDRPSSLGTITTWMNESDLSWKFATGPITHTLIAGAEIDSETAALTRLVNQESSIAPTSLLHPDADEAVPHQSAIRQKPTTKTNTIGLYAMDTVQLDPHWQIVGALRWDHFDANFRQPISPATHFSHTDSIVSPRASLVYKPEENQTYYFSYGTSFNPSAENLSLSASNADLGPEKDRTFELGGKIAVLDGLLSLTAAAFNTEMTNARISDPLNPGLQALTGNLRVNGVEFDATGRITPNWEVQAGYTYLDAQSKGLVAAGVKGDVPNTTHHQANLWSVYDFDSGWKLGGGFTYLGRRVANAGGTAHVPGFVVWDAMASYQLSDNLALQLNGYNLFDRNYFLNSYYTRDVENHVIPGAGRTFTLTAIVDL